MRLVGALLVVSVLLMALAATPVLGANMRSLQAAATATIEGKVAHASRVLVHMLRNTACPPIQCMGLPRPPIGVREDACN
jgi:hypothetical protein